MHIGKSNALLPQHCREGNPWAAYAPGRGASSLAGMPAVGQPCRIADAVADVIDPKIKVCTAPVSVGAISWTGPIRSLV
jgi:hypothetical protein